MAYLGKIINYGFHYNAYPETFELAKRLRKSQTPAEKALWNELRNRRLSGYKFRRQHPVGQYIVDFYHVQTRLAIELDGKIHDDIEIQEHDLNRAAELDRLGITVIRFTNEEVLNEISKVLHEIELKIMELTCPPPLH